MTARQISERAEALLDGLLIGLGGLLVLAFLAGPGPAPTEPEPQQWTAREIQHTGGGATAYSYPALGYDVYVMGSMIYIDWLTERPTPR